MTELDRPKNPHRAAPPNAEKQTHQERVLTDGASSLIGDIADAVVIKDGDLCFLTDSDGILPLEGAHGFGLYYHDCRYLNGYVITLSGRRPVRLVANAELGYLAMLQLTNPEIRSEETCLERDTIGIKWERLLDGKTPALHDRLLFQNFGTEAAVIPVALAFQAAFEDIFTIRELVSEERGLQQPPSWKQGVLSFHYEGKDQIHRSLSIHWHPVPDGQDGTTARFHLTLAPQECREILLSLVVAESPDRQAAQPKHYHQPDRAQMQAVLREASDAWLARETRFLSDSLVLNRVMEQSQRALHVLQSRLHDHSYFVAGVPWFVALFGRDSLITALQTLAYDPEIAEQTLRLLGLHQGQREDSWREEQPGKILHELRVGEKARLGEIPHTPYYGTIDATVLFLVLIGRHAAWTGQLALFHELRPNIDAALTWMARYGDSNGDGYLDYQRISEHGLDNQGWKDSGDALVNADGSAAIPPIALVEVQAYAYEALTSMAELYRRDGDTGRAGRLQQDAAMLRARFNRDFWLEEKGCYALALQAGGRPAAVVTSNAGHALWCGIADEEKARRTMESLMAESMFSGWGIRTLSADEGRYNPMGYHLGTVWPHDNSLIAAGFRRYGHERAAARIFSGLLEAALRFPDNQLPELFCGFARHEYPVPVRYPVACHPQAWAAASIPYLIESILGLRPDALNNRLRICRPALPEFLSFMELSGVRVGSAKIDLRFERSNGAIRVHPSVAEGSLEIIIEP
ncbi:MAG: putative Amylo-alpha,6-glucosidase [Nitrospira sp.]|jgi:glycogen debranching enzyme|nr:putative Amylo-alpha,6-glucosidase [Nitrospira sp.]